MLTEGNRAEERRKWSNDWLKRKNFSLCIIRPHAKFYFTLCVITGKFTFLFVFTPTVKYFIRLVEKVCALKSENGFDNNDPIHKATALELFNIH